MYMKIEDAIKYSSYASKWNDIQIQFASFNHIFGIVDSTPVRVLEDFGVPSANEFLLIKYFIVDGEHCEKANNPEITFGIPVGMHYYVNESHIFSHPDRYPLHRRRYPLHQNQSFVEVFLWQSRLWCGARSNSSTDIDIDIPADSDEDGIGVYRFKLIYECSDMLPDDIEQIKNKTIEKLLG